MNRFKAVGTHTLDGVIPKVIVALVVIDHAGSGLALPEDACAHQLGLLALGVGVGRGR